MNIDMGNDILYLVLTLEQDEDRVENVNNIINEHPYFEKFKAFHWKHDWNQIFEFFNENNIKIDKNYNPKKGKIAVWASTLKAIKFAQNKEHQYLVILQDDAKINKNFKKQLYNNFIKNNYLDKPGARLGIYGVGYIVKIDKIQEILNFISNNPIDRASDHYLINKSRKKKKELPKRLFKECKKRIVFLNKEVSNNSNIRNSNKSA